MKTSAAVRLTAALLFIFIIPLAGCSPDADNTPGGALKLIAVNFPAYDFARQICGDLAVVTLLLPPGSEAHSYEPAPRDIISIGECDLLVRVGGESEAWLDKIVGTLDDAPEIFAMTDVPELLAEELKEGMTEEEHDHEENGGEVEYDEHVWTSPANAALIVNGLADAISSLDSANAAVYRTNADAYIAEINALDADFREYFNNYDGKPLIFGDRFPFLYFVREFGVDYYAAFPGCAAETEPSAATISFLTDKAVSEKVAAIYKIEFSTHRIAETIAEPANIPVKLFHSCHNVTKDELESGATYVSLMRANLETLTETLD